MVVGEEEKVVGVGKWSRDSTDSCGRLHNHAGKPWNVPAVHGRPVWESDCLIRKSMERHGTL